VREGSEEYLDSEKYQIRVRDYSRSDSLAELIARVNAIRRAHPALQYDWGLQFHETDNEQLLCFSKRAPVTAAGTPVMPIDPVLVVVNLDPANMQHGHIKLPLYDWNIPLDGAVEARDLLSGETYLWHGEWNYVRLDPPGRVAHVLALAFES
jgi:starch synthase (maltosyl-transferring)